MHENKLRPEFSLSAGHLHSNHLPPPPLLYCTNNPSLYLRKSRTHPHTQRNAVRCSAKIQYSHKHTKQTYSLKFPTHTSFKYMSGQCWGEGGGKGGGGSICAGTLGAWQSPRAAQPSIRPIHPSLPLLHPDQNPTSAPPGFSPFPSRTATFPSCLLSCEERKYGWHPLPLFDTVAA